MHAGALIPVGIVTEDIDDASLGHGNKLWKVEQQEKGGARRRPDAAGAINVMLDAMLNDGGYRGISQQRGLGADVR
ncbi:hypothetical protein [Mycetohabitans endofungorum]|uniref:hypothetical protein n=1 Tax=Mycetohabitans endofungorum TaxID=417203 RepID=UPI002B05A8CB|nr:hypothetical protein [Mycetohabitans endofungorum]